MADEEDSEGTHVCYECVGDEFLKAEIRSDGHKQQCDFCGERRKAWPLGELAGRIGSIIEEHFELTPSDPRDEGVYYGEGMDWERRGDPVAYVIADIAEIGEELAEAVREHLSEHSSYDPSDGEEDVFATDACYEEAAPKTDGLHESWDFFREQIKTRARFFDKSAQRALDEIFGDLASLKTWQGEPAIRQILPKDDARFLFRARIAYSESELKDILSKPVRRLGPPPSRLARAGRMNAGGISVFYGAMEADTCIAEARAPVGSYVVLGRFEIIKPLRILDLDVLSKVVTRGSWFDPEFSTRSTGAAFLSQLVAEISRPVMPRDEEFEYLPTQAVAEYLASCVEPRLDGIIFHSAQTDGKGRNVVLFNHASGVEPYELPDGTKVEINMGWATEDDYDDSISIWETVPAPKRKKRKKKKPDDEVINFAEILERASHDRAAETEEDDQFYGEPTLKLDVGEITAVKVTAVTYGRTTRSIMRHRRTATVERRRKAR